MKKSWLKTWGGGEWRKYLAKTQHFFYYKNTQQTGNRKASTKAHR